MGDADDEEQAQTDARERCGSARRDGRRGRHQRAGQVRREGAGRPGIRRIQGIRGLGDGRGQSDRRHGRSDTRQSRDDRRVSSRRSRQRQGVSGWIEEGENPLDREERARRRRNRPPCQGPARHRFHGQGQQAVRGDRQLGLRAVQLCSRVRHVHADGHRVQLRIRVPHDRGEKGATSSRRTERGEGTTFAAAIRIALARDGNIARSNECSVGR